MNRTGGGGGGGERWRKGREGGPAVPGCQHTGPSFESRDRSPSTSGARAVPPACTPAITHNAFPPIRWYSKTYNSVRKSTTGSQTINKKFNNIPRSFSKDRKFFKVPISDDGGMFTGCSWLLLHSIFTNFDQISRDN